MSCVNKNSKEFTDAVKRLDVHPSALEVVAHKYLNNEDRFPTDKEIMSELSGKPFNATMDAFKWYTKNFLHKPIVLGNLREAHSKLKELRDILGENDAVSMYKDNRGNYVLSVGTPKLESLPFVIDNTLIDTLLEEVRDTNPYHQIFKRLVDLIGKDNISIRTGLTAENKTIKEGGHPAGYYQDMREIVFYPENMDFLNNYTEKGKESYIFRTVAHELVHQFTVDTLYKDPSLLTEEERVFQRDITSIYDEARKHVEENEAYGMTNVSEFIAEALTNRWFQKKLAEIKSTKGKSLWGKIAEAFRKIFNIQGVDISNTLLEDVLSTTEEFMENQERRRKEAQLAYEAFISEVKQGDVLGFESPSLNRVVAQYSNKVSDHTYYMFTIGEGESKRYAVNIPINSKDTLAEAREKVYDILRENGLDTDRYGVSREFKKVGERDVLYVSPKRSKKIDAEIKGTTKSETPRFTEAERYFLNYLYDVRPDLASDVVDGILDIGELMRHEDELGAFAETVKDAQLSREIENSYNEELGNKIQGIMQKLYPEIELNFTDEINPEDIEFGIEEYKALHPEVETLARQMPLEEAMEVLKNSNRKSLEFQLSKGDRKQYERRLTNIRETGVDLETNEFIPELTKEDIALFKYLDTIQEKKHQNVIFNWYYDGIINIFEDKYKVDRAIELAKKFNLNLKTFSSPMQVINEYGDKEVTGDGSKWFDLYDNNTEHLSNKREEDGVIVYDVTDSEVTAEFISENIISKFFDRSPWCIFQFNNQKIWEGEYYWNSYNKFPRKIAFDKDTGKPVAMFAASNKPTWWDTNDRPNSSLEVAKTPNTVQKELKKLGFTPYTGRYGNYSKGSEIEGDFYIYKVLKINNTKDNNIKLTVKEHRSGRKLRRRTEYSKKGKLSITTHFNEDGSINKVTIDYDGKVNFEHINIDDVIKILNYTYSDFNSSTVSTFTREFLDIYELLLADITELNRRKLLIQENYNKIHRILNDFDTIFEDSNLLREFNSGRHIFIRRITREIAKGTLNQYLAQTKFKSLAQLKGLVKSILLKNVYESISRNNDSINQRFNDIRIWKNKLNALYTILSEYSNGSLNSKELKNKLSSTRSETPNQLEDDLLPFQLDKDRILGVADLDALSVLIDRVHQKQDTLPHEYAHHYINWFRNSDLVQEGIKRFGSEEQLVQAIGEQVVKQKGEAYNWWQKFVHFIMNILNKDQRVLDKLTDSFLKRASLEVDKDMSNIENKLQFQMDDHKQLAFFGEETKDNGASITYTPPGQKTQTYTIKGSHIYNSEGKEVYAKDGKHRNRIFANLAVQQGRAVVVEYKGKKYVVNNKDAIISVATGDKMNWSEENGDRKAIVELAKAKFSSMRSNNTTQSVQTTTNTPNEVSTQELNKYIHTEGEDKGFLTEEGERLLSSTFDKNEFTEGTTGVSLLPGVKGDQIRIDFKSPRTGNTCHVIYNGSPTRKTWDLYNSKWGNTTDVSSDNYWRVIEMVVPKWLRDLVESGEYSRMSNTPTRTDDLGSTIYSTELEELFESKYKVLKQGNNTKYNNSVVKKAINLLNSQKSDNIILGELGSNSNLVITGDSRSTAQKAKELGGIDTLRHPDTNGMHFGNPFSHANYKGAIKVGTVKEAVIAYEQWLRGEKYQDVEPERRQWILNQINNGSLVGKPLVYYTDKVPDNSYGRATYDPVTAPNHAHILQKLINEAGSKSQMSSLTEETKAKILQFSAEFEGGYNSLIGKVPESLLSKVEDYIMSEGYVELSETEAQDFLNYAEAAYAEQETVDQDENQIKKENQTYMERSIKIVEQIDNLTSSSIISATEVRHIAEQAVYWISDHITEIQKTPGLAEKTYGEEHKDKDFASMSRADVVNTIGPEKIILMCKEKFSPDNADYESFDTIDKAELIVNNWDAIMMLASDVFTQIEEFSIVLSKDGKVIEVKEDYTDDADNFNSSNMESAVKEAIGNLQEHWQVETRTLDIISTMSKMVKQFLSKCYLLDKDGNNITSEFGINERVNLREATNSINNWTQGALNLEQMIIKLQEKVDSNPWVKQVIDKLSDKSGKETDLQGQFFGVFYKPFQSYSIVIKEDGKYKSFIVNENPALSEAMTQITTQYKIGEHPLFTTNGINKTSFNELKSSFDELTKYNHQGYDLSNTENKNDAAKTLGYISNLFGYYVTPEMVVNNLNKDTFKSMYSALNYIIKALEKNLDNATYDPFNFKKDKDSINGNMKAFLKPITDQLEATAISATYDNGKMYQSYTTPSYTSKLFQKFKQTGQAFDDFIMAEYYVPWFHTGNNIERGWRNAWLRELVNDSKAREIFKHKVQLNFNKHQYMKNMSDVEYTLSVFAEYFSESTSSGKSRVPAWFRMPMQSNKPSSEFIRFYSERGANYKESLTKGFKLIFDQELSRIQTVEMSNFTKEDSRFIKNFYTNGKKFVFLDFMNDFLTGDKKSSELGKLIRQKLDGNKIDEARMNKLVKEEIMQAMDKKAESVVSTWEKQGILEGAKEIENIGTTKEEIRENLINFVWNDTFAAMNILELTITDPAFYANAEDLQKRLAQTHSPGIRGNVEAIDYEGNPVTDGKYRTINLTDFDTFISNIVDNVSIVFDRKIDVAKREGNTEEVKSLEALKDSLVRPRTYKKDGSIDDAGGAFWNINVADAQAFNCPTSYRKKAFVFGKWSREAENIYKKLREGTYTYSDLKIAFQPLKPFVYSQIIKDAGIDGVPLSTLKVPIQYKNSEYLLIMADALLRGENTGKPNLLRAIYDVMENSHFDENGNYKTNGIDTIQFDSAVKSGPRGKISLNDLIDKSNGEAIAVARMEAAIYETKAVEKKVLNPETGVEETRTIYERTGNYNNNVVNEFLAEDFCLQQEIPEHFKEHEQLHGSQLRYLIISELENFNYLGEPVTYNLEGKQVTAQEFKTEYENIIAESIQESIEELAEELSLNNIGSIKDRNIALSKILQREILSSPRYGVDLLIACSVDSDGRFRIPLGDPIQSKRVEQLINSIIKNRINKQKIAGGPAVQVSSFGTSKELNIRFKDKKGNILLTRAEYEKNPIKTSTNDILSYKDYIKENQAGIAYFEAFAPIYCNDLFTKFADSNGVINTQAIEMLEPDLLKMIGYRIPTEDKYSMTPIKIVGFLPREAGDGIMLPYDITLLTGSDFDIDKIYIMRKDYNIKDNEKSRSFMHELLYNELVSSQKSKLKYETKNALNDLVNQFLNDPFNSSSLVNQKVAKGYMTMTKGAYDKMLRLYLQNMYTVDKPTKGRSYRNNKIVDMTYEVLTHETSVDKMLNPGGFDPQKKMGYLVEAYRQPDNKYTWEQLKAMSIDQLKDLINKDKNLSYIDTHIQFYRQNNAAGSLIGIFAVERVAHAVLESGSPDNTSVYKMDVDNVCKITRPFTVAGKEFGGLMSFDMVYDENNQLIGKILGSLVAASADAVKDPVLNLMNINSYTASILTTLIRFGMSFDNAALFLSQSIISDVLAEFNRENITGYKSLSKVVQDRIDKLKQDNNIDETSILNEEELTYEELVEGLKPNAKPKVAYKTLIAFSNFHKMVEAMKMPTFATRFNSMTSAVGPLIIDNLITEHKMEKFSLESNIVDADSNLITIEDILNNHPILGKFADTIGIAKQLFSNMPANSTGFRNILNLVSESPLSRVIYGDRKILSSLSDFYQSYLAMRGGVINSKDLSYFITEFPKEFIKKEYKEKYSDNALIQAIKYSTSKSGRVTLKVDTTGLDAQQKEKYSSAWTDLYKVDPDLAIKLFKYNFFKGGIGFSPKTFMNLVPTYIKERIPNYVDTFRVLPSVVPEIVLDQFIRNNWNNNKLVPRKKVSLEKISNGNVKAYKLSEIEALKDVQYFKTKVGDVDKLFMQVSENEFKEITPLGNNKEYLEISETTIDSPFSTPSEAKVEVPASEDGKESELGETKVDTDMEDTSGYTISESKLNDLLYQALVIEGKRTKKEAETYIEKFKTKTEEEKAKLERATKNFLRNRFNILGIKFNEELIDRVYKKLC